MAAANKASYAMPLAGALAGGIALVVRSLCEQHKAEVVGMSTYVIAVGLVCRRPRLVWRPPAPGSPPTSTDPH